MCSHWPLTCVRKFIVCMFNDSSMACPLSMSFHFIKIKITRNSSCSRYSRIYFCCYHFHGLTSTTVFTSLIQSTICWTISSVVSPSYGYSSCSLCRSFEQLISDSSTIGKSSSPLDTLPESTLSNVSSSESIFFEFVQLICSRWAIGLPNFISLDFRFFFQCLCTKLKFCFYGHNFIFNRLLATLNTTDFIAIHFQFLAPQQFSLIDLLQRKKKLMSRKCMTWSYSEMRNSTEVILFLSLSLTWISQCVCVSQLK